MDVHTKGPDSGELWFRRLDPDVMKVHHESIRAEPEHSSASDLDTRLAPPALGRLGDDKQPEQLLGGLNISALNPATWISASLADGQPAFDFGATSTPSMNQGSNPPSHMIALRHGSTSDLHFDHLWNNLDSAPLFDTTGYTGPANLAGFGLHNQVSSVNDSQGGGLQFGAQLVGGGYVTGRAIYPEAHSINALGLEPLLECLRPRVPRLVPYPLIKLLCPKCIQTRRKGMSGAFFTLLQYITPLNPILACPTGLP